MTMEPRSLAAESRGKLKTTGAVACGGKLTSVMLVKDCDLLQSAPKCLLVACRNCSTGTRAAQICVLGQPIMLQQSAFLLNLPLLFCNCRLFFVDSVQAKQDVAVTLMQQTWWKNDSTEEIDKD